MTISMTFLEVAIQDNIDDERSAKSPTEVTVSIYVKGYGASPAREAVKVDYHTRSVEVSLPALDGTDAKSFTLGPLAGSIAPGECSERVLGTKIELRLKKDEPAQWPSLLSSGESVKLSSLPAGSTSTQASGSTYKGATTAAPSASKPAQRKNWDALVDAELAEEDDPNNPNAGGDAALQKLFSGIYANADEDTKRAMIKSFTESGGTTLSTDWSQIGKEKTPTRPPEGMYEMKM